MVSCRKESITSTCSVSYLTQTTWLGFNSQSVLSVNTATSQAMPVSWWRWTDASRRPCQPQWPLSLLFMYMVQAKMSADSLHTGELDTPFPGAVWARSWLLIHVHMPDHIHVVCPEGAVSNHLTVTISDQKITQLFHLHCFTWASAGGVCGKPRDKEL